MGVTLLVGIAVALAAVSAVMMLSFGNSTDSGPPEASFELEESSDGLHFKHAGGDRFDPSSMYVLRNDDREPVTDIVSTSSITAGDRIGPVDPNGASEVELVWDGDQGSHTVATFDGYETLDVSILNRDETVAYGSEAVAGDGGETTALAPSGANALGPLDADLTGDGATNMPYVGSGGDLKITDDTGDTQTLVSSSASANPATSKTILGVGHWNGTGPSVFYANADEDTIYRVDDGGSPSQVAQPASGVSGVIGIGDIDGDATDELLFADGSQQIRYLSSGGSITELDSGGAGENNGIGVGQPPDFDGDGTVRVGTVDGNQNVKIIGDVEDDMTFTSTSAKKAPVTTADVDDDSSLEIVYINTNGYLSYLDDPLGSPSIETLTDSSGNQIPGDDTLGVVS